MYAIRSYYVRTLPAGRSRCWAAFAQYPDLACPSPEGRADAALVHAPCENAASIALRERSGIARDRGERVRTEGADAGVLGLV